MTKKELETRKNEILLQNNKIIAEMKSPWEIAHQNASTVHDLTRLIEVYLKGGEEDE